MPITVEKLPDEAIFILRVRAPLLIPEDLRSSNKDIAAQAAQFTGDYFRITDLTDSQLNFGQLMRGIAEAATNPAGSMSDSRSINIYVGSGKMVELLATSPLQKAYNGKRAQQFETLEAAVTYARSELSKIR